MYMSIANRSLAASRHLLRLNKCGSSYVRNHSTSNQQKQHQVGDVIHGYKLLDVDYIKELNIKPYYLKHEVTGSEHLHIEKTGDSNNVFGVSLRTPPKDSTGVTHILEHLALCGSKKFAVRDPFFKMLTRSLATFMNAFTGPDFTLYPFSTENRKDFENLLSIYIDAVYFPRLRHADFRQEGWRLEHERPDKKDTPIVIKGVVYNEMKGVFNSSASIYERHLLNHLYPETAYHHESGGDPEHIPKLSHDDLKKFHALHYHPSNSKFFTYGDIPLENHLEYINNVLMSKFSHNSESSEQSFVAEQESWKEPKSVNITCPLDPLSASPEKQTTTSISYMLPTLITNTAELFPLQILSSLLLDGPNAPFFKNLVESGIGSDFSPSTGFSNFTKQPYFSVGLQDIHPNDVKKVHEIIEKTLIDTAKSGFPDERVKAILHRVELSTKHITENFGLKLVMALESIWLHDGDAIDALKINKYVEKFKNDLSRNKSFWADLINKYFLNNNHKLILTMNPDPAFEEDRKSREASILMEKLNKMTDVDKQTILYEGMELMKIQQSREDTSVLPCLDPSKDISRDLRYNTVINQDNYNGVNTQFCEQPTNEIVYFGAITNVDKLFTIDNLIDYLPLFCDVANKLGAGKYNRNDLSEMIKLKTGGLSIGLMLNPSLTEFDDHKSELSLRSYCLRRNTADMFELWTEIYKKIHFQENQDFLHQLIKASAASLAQNVSNIGNILAIKKSAQSLTKVGSIDERLTGLSFVARMKDIVEKESIESVVEKLRMISDIVMDPQSMRCALNAEPEFMSCAASNLHKFIDNIKQISQDKSKAEPDYGKLKKPYKPTIVEDLKLPFSTHYVAKSMRAVPFAHEDFPKLLIMSKLISSRYLLPEVREKGGAYGSSLKLSTSGVLSFSSYRDPNTKSTMLVFDSAADWASSKTEYTSKDIEESKLGVFQDVDKPIPPSRRGLETFLYGITDDMRRQHRCRLLDVSPKDVRTVAAKYLNQDDVGRYTI